MAGETVMREKDGGWRQQRQCLRGTIERYRTHASGMSTPGLVVSRLAAPPVAGMT